MEKPKHIGASDYDVIGLDASWHHNNLDMRYEYVGSIVIGVFTLDDTKWSTWYAQITNDSSEHKLIDSSIREPPALCGKNVIMLLSQC